MSFPKTCDGCGDDFSFQHALDCKNGGLVKKDITMYVTTMSVSPKLHEGGGFTVEPILALEDAKTGHTLLQADWSVRVVWEGSPVVLFDNRIIDANAPSYLPSTSHGRQWPSKRLRQRRRSILQFLQSYAVL